MKVNQFVAAGVLIAASMAAACSADRKATSIRSAELAVAQPESIPAVNGALLPPELEEGTSYHDVRSALVAGGWGADGDLDQCLTTSVGDKYSEVCAKESGAMCGLCSEFREIDACTGEGHCYMTFKKDGSELRISTYGDVLRIREPGSEPVVQEWNVSVSSTSSRGETK